MLFGKMIWGFFLVRQDILLRRLSALEWPAVTVRQLGLGSLGQFGFALLASIIGRNQNRRICPHLQLHMRCSVVK